MVFTSSGREVLESVGLFILPFIKSTIEHFSTLIWNNSQFITLLVLKWFFKSR